MRIKQRRHKFNAKKTTVDGITFDSKLEARRYTELKLLERAGTITDLQLQPKFLLQEKFKDRTGKTHRSIHYIADFQYVEDGVDVVEDTKGYKGVAVFNVKKKLFLYRYPEYDFRIIE